MRLVRDQGVGVVRLEFEDDIEAAAEFEVAERVLEGMLRTLAEMMSVGQVIRMAAEASLRR